MLTYSLVDQEQLVGCFVSDQGLLCLTIGQLNSNHNVAGGAQLEHSWATATQNNCHSADACNDKNDPVFAQGFDCFAGLCC
jgi:hypothetical protein